MMMSKWFIVTSYLVLFLISLHINAAIDDSGYNSNQDQNNTSNVSDTSATSGSGNLLGEMQKKTEKALKTFKNLTNKDQSKKNFFADEGSSPTSSELEGASFGDNDTPDEKEFKIPGADKGGPFSSSSGGSM